MGIKIAKVLNKKIKEERKKATEQTNNGGADLSWWDKRTTGQKWAAGLVVAGLVVAGVFYYNKKKSITDNGIPGPIIPPPPMP